MDKNQIINKPYQIPTVVNEKQAELQLVTKPQIESKKPCIKNVNQLLYQKQPQPNAETQQLVIKKFLVVNKNQAELQPVTKTQIESKLKDFEKSCIKNVNQLLSQRQPQPDAETQQLAIKKVVLNIRKPQPKKANFDIKQEQQSIVDLSIANDDGQQNFSDQEDEDYVSQNSRAESEKESWDSEYEEAEISTEDKRAVIRDHILSRRQNENKIKQEKRFKCKFCPKQYNHVKGLNEHISEAHSFLIEDGFLCLFCGKNYRTSEDRDNHQKNICPYRGNLGKKRKSPYQNQIDSQYDWIMKQKAKGLDKN